MRDRECFYARRLRRLNRAKLSFSALLLLFSSPALPVSGNLLLDACESKTEFGNGFCVGFMQAMKYSVAEFPYSDKKCKKVLRKVPVEQLTDIVIKELENAPEQRHYSEYSISFVAIGDAFNCLAR